jgi:hypothetical protein
LRCKLAMANDVAARGAFSRAGEEGKRPGGEGERGPVEVGLEDVGFMKTMGIGRGNMGSGEVTGWHTHSQREEERGRERGGDGAQWCLAGKTVVVRSCLEVGDGRRWAAGLRWAAKVEGIPGRL